MNGFGGGGGKGRSMIDVSNPYIPTPTHSFSLVTLNGFGGDSGKSRSVTDVSNPYFKTFINYLHSKI